MHTKNLGIDTVFNLRTKIGKLILDKINDPSRLSFFESKIKFWSIKKYHCRFSWCLSSKTGFYIFLYFRKWIFLYQILWNFFYFLKKKLFLYFGKRKPRKKYFYFRKLLIFQEVTFRARNPLLRNILYFRKSNFLAPSLKNLLHFRRELAKTENQIYTIFVRWERTFQI